MRWAWPFKSRIDDDRNGEDNHSSTLDPSPDFLCVGAQKAGTSWLYRQLAEHPDFWMPPFKELHYFDQLARTHTPPPRPRDARDRCFLERLTRLNSRSYIDVEEYARFFLV